MDKILSLFSQYELKARFFPALLILAPSFFSIAIWYPEIIKLESSIFTVIVLIIILFFLAKLSREMGVKKQKKLLKEWGNFPSTIMLRHRDNSIDPTTKKRYHNYLKSKISNINLPTAEEESENPDLYEKEYNSAVKWLLEKTRDYKKYDLLLQDNINYGFSRNMLGVKPVGILFCIISLAINLFGIYQSYQLNIKLIPLKIWLGFLVSIIFLFLWIFFVKKSWVKNTSEAYARTLLASCEEIEE